MQAFLCSSGPCAPHTRLTSSLCCTHIPPATVTPGSLPASLLSPPHPVFAGSAFLVLWHHLRPPWHSPEATPHALASALGAGVFQPLAAFVQRPYPRPGPTSGAASLLREWPARPEGIRHFPASALLVVDVHAHTFGVYLNDTDH